jgi:hypothetical protein
MVRDTSKEQGWLRYLRFKLSFRDLLEMMAEHGPSIAHTTISARLGDVRCDRFCTYLETTPASSPDRVKYS